MEAEIPMVGRKAEQEILLKAWHSPEAELVAVLGRRRVGKTFLVRTTFAGKLVFDMSGLQDATNREKLLHFAQRLQLAAKNALPLAVPQNWQEAFHTLILYIEQLDQKEKPIIFLDEFPWLAGKKSDFTRAFGAFWNDWASMKKIVVVICGSAASWMIEHVVKSKGGLHNRITRRIFLQPFTLNETDQYFKSRGVHLNHYHTIELYMAMGGIPQYLKSVEPGLTASQAIDKACFSPLGELRTEFLELYPALFDQSEKHIDIIRQLAKHPNGQTRQEMLIGTGYNDGGRFSKWVEELESSGFIASFYGFGNKKKELRYRLTDAYSLFYLKFIEPNRSEGAGTWLRLSQLQTYISWSGYAFENISLTHIDCIKKALGIAAVYSESSSFYVKTSDLGRGAQIDLVIDRNDKAIHLIEIKFYKTPFAITKELAAELLMKKAIFQSCTQTRKLLFTTVLSTFALTPNQYSLEAVDQGIDMGVFFE
jgi:uncharacterized protein